MDSTHGNFVEDLCKGESHSTAYDEGVDFVEHVFDELDLVGHLGTTEDGKEGAIGAFEDLCKVFELFLHEKTGCLFLEVDANHAGMSTVCGTKGIVDVKIAECGELLLEGVYDVFWDLYLVWAFALFGGVEAEVLEEEDGTILCVIDCLFDIGTDAIVEEGDGLFDLFREYVCDGSEGVFLGSLSIWTTEVGHEHDNLGFWNVVIRGRCERRGGWTYSSRAQS